MNNMPDSVDLALIRALIDNCLARSLSNINCYAKNYLGNFIMTTKYKMLALASIGSKSLTIVFTLSAILVTELDTAKYIAAKSVNAQFTTPVANSCMRLNQLEKRTADFVAPLYHFDQPQIYFF